MTLNYLSLIGARDVSDFVGKATAVFPKFTTVNEGYADKLRAMKNAVEEYFKDESIDRPFLYLILGPPGAGKSYLMKQLVKQLENDTKQQFAFQNVNISEVLDPREIHNFYENIDQNNDKRIRTVTLFDEVDVRWQNGSAIKQLINPIYDGSYWDGTRFRKFGRCAFFFAGSYLQDRETLMKTQKLLTGVDLSKFLLDLYIDVRRRGDAEALRDVTTALAFCQAQERWRADIDPRSDTILYLKNLEKIRDFLSRIAGNVFEMTDLSAPLHVTQEAFTIGGDGPVRPSPRMRSVEVVRLVKTREKDRFEYFQSPSEPLLQYKNVLLCERLLRVVMMVRQRFEKRFEEAKLKSFEIDRPLLNFLTVVPLINGMRSLEQLVNRLAPPPDHRVREKAFKSDEMSMIIHNAAEFADVLQVWYRVGRENPQLRTIMQVSGVSDSQPVSVPL